MFTIIIPTRNRSRYVARLVQFYDKLLFPYSIIVADSSSNAECEANAKIVHSVQNRMAIKHLIFDHEICFYLKCASALESADTKYAVFCGDDDFIVPSAIAKGISFLEEHEDYSEVHGNSILFEFEHQSMTGINTLERLFTRTYKQRETLDQDDPIIRLEKYFTVGVTSFYSIHRRHNIARNMNLMHQTMSANSPHFGELLLDSLSVIQGKSKFIDMFYMARQLSPERGSLQNITWYELLASTDILKVEYERFYDCLASEINYSTNMLIADANVVINKGFERYVSDLRGSQLIKRISRVIKLLADIECKDLERHQLYLLFKSPRQALKNIREKRDSLSIGYLLKPASPYHGDFLPVYNSIVSNPYGVRDSELAHP